MAFIENRKFYETEEEKCQFICESFQLDANEILNEDEKLKEAVIKLFLDNFEVLATHQSQYGETEEFEMKIDLVPGRFPVNPELRPLNPDQKDNLQKQINEWLEQGVSKPSVSSWALPHVPVGRRMGGQGG